MKTSFAKKDEAIRYYREKATELIEKCKELEAGNERLKGINSALCAKSNSYLIQNARLEEERDELKRQLAEYKGLLSDLMEVVEEPPERNCSCHISPPCSDCVEWSGLREALSEARTAMKGAPE